MFGPAPFRPARSTPDDRLAGLELFFLAASVSSLTHNPVFAIVGLPVENRYISNDMNRK